MQCKITLFAVRCPALLLQILRWPLRMTGKAPCSRFLALLGMTVCWLLGMTVCWLLGMTVCHRLGVGQKEKTSRNHCGAFLVS